MKKVLLFAVIAAIAYSCGPTGGYTIAGNIEGLDVETVYLIDQECTGAIDDSAEVKNGKFRFEGTVAEPVMVEIIDRHVILATFILENGRIKIKGDIEDPDSIEATGTPANDAFTEFLKSQRELAERFEAAETEDELEVILNDNDTNILNAIDNNSDNYFGLHLLSRSTSRIEAEEILAKLDKFPAELQNTELGKRTKGIAEVQKQVGVGKPYKDIVLPDRDGNRLALSSYVGEGKYVLVVFWASWCGPCMMQVPYLKDAYDTYHAKGFEIYGISLDSGDRAEKEWLSAVDKNNMDWVKVALCKDPENTAPIDYSITTIPANFLVSPEGIIVAKNLYGEQIKEELSKYIE